MYLDANGDGVHTSADQLASNGTATTVDVWINTNHNRNGSDAVCDIDGTSPLGINSYVFNLRASSGLVSYSGFINRIASFTTSFGEVNPGTGRNTRMEMADRQGWLGPYRLATLTITGLSGTPRVDIVDLSSDRRTSRRSVPEPVAASERLRQHLQAGRPWRRFRLA
jgi:hypothetical protein